MELILLYGSFLALCAIPVVICLRGWEDHALSSLLVCTAVLYCASLYGITYAVPYAGMFFIHLPAFLLHWFAWLWTNAKKAYPRSRWFPLLTVWLLLLVNALCFRNLITLGCAFVYILIVTILYAVPAKAQGEGEWSNSVSYSVTEGD